MANFNLNKVILGGRIASDVSLAVTPGGVSYVRFTLAVTRRGANGETDLVKKISSQKTFSGVYGDIRFERGANANVQIMSVDSSAFVDKTQCPAK